MDPASLRQGVQHQIGKTSSAPAVALSGDGSTLTVGAPSEDSAATGLDGNQSDDSAGDSGAVYVFARSGTTWAQSGLS